MPHNLNFCLHPSIRKFLSESAIVQYLLVLVLHIYTPKVLQTYPTMDCCSSDGYAQAYTDILRKLTNNNKIGIVVVLICALCMCRYLFRRTQPHPAPAMQNKKED